MSAQPFEAVQTARLLRLPFPPRIARHSHSIRTPICQPLATDSVCEHMHLIAALNEIQAAGEEGQLWLWTAG
jgi:hypothetical protein